MISPLKAAAASTFALSVVVAGIAVFDSGPAGRESVPAVSSTWESGMPILNAVPMPSMSKSELAALEAEPPDTTPGSGTWIETYIIPDDPTSVPPAPEFSGCEEHGSRGWWAWFRRVNIRC